MSKPALAETIARAIYEGRNGPGCKPWSICTKAHKEPYLKDAVAAISAIASADFKIEPMLSEEIIRRDRDEWPDYPMLSAIGDGK